MKNIALVGCGNWGSNILRDLLSLGCCVSVVDIDTAARDRAILMGAAEVYDSINSLTSFDGYVVAVPIPDLAPMTASLLTFRKPIFSEKTLLRSLDDYHLLKSLPGSNQIFTMHKWHYHPGIEALKQIAASGKLGTISEIVTVRSAWVDDFHGGDVFWTQGIHDLTIVKHILGIIPKSIQYISVICSEEGTPVSFRAALGSDPAVIMSVSGRHTSKISGVSIHGSNGTAELQNALDDSITIRTITSSEKMPINTDYPLYLELKEFVDYLNGGPRPRCDLESAWEMSKSLIALRHAAGIK